ncbi:MAG: hypothetical protein RR843_11115, partial [Clostridia bacterium]
PSGIDDLTGNCLDQDYGYRIVSGELQILADNNAADPAADLGANSAAWKAILPSATDNTHTLVTPGTAGTLKWTWQNGKITLDTAAPTNDNEYRSTPFAQLAVNSTNVPHVPDILRELGIFPIAGDDTLGVFYHRFADGERFPRRGGVCGGTSGAGLGCVGSGDARSGAAVIYGVRGGFLEACPPAI